MKRRDGFTLVEILVVVGIMSLLAGLMLGGLGAARGKAKKTLAKTEIDQIVTAWNTYYADYKHFPDIWPNGDDTNLDLTKMSYDAIRVLQGNYDKNDDCAKLNSRRTAYLDFHAEFTDAPTLGVYEDPWGNVYQVSIDQAKYDGKVDVPKKDGSGNETISFSVAVWSMGPDGLPSEGGTPADDIRSWDKR